MSLRICICLFAYLAAPTSDASEKLPTAEELLVKYEFAVGRLARVHLHAETNESISDNEVSGTQRIEIYRDSERWKVTKTHRTRRKVDGRFQSFEGGTEYLLAAEGLHSQWSIPRNGDESVSGYIDRAEAEQRLWKGYMGQASILFGQTSGDDRQPLWRVMRGAESLKLLPEMEAVDGVKTFRLESSGKFGSHSIWIDPNSGFLPRRIDVVKRSGDFLNLRKLGVGILKETATGRLEFAPVKTEIKETREKFDKILIEGREGRPMITAFEWTRTYLFETGAESIHREDFRLRDVEFGDQRWPSDAFEPTLQIRDGRNLPVRLGPDLPVDNGNYEWWKGRIRKKF